MSYGEPAIRFGLVEDINDPTGSGRIKVRLSYNDRGYGVGDLAYAFPLNPKTWHIKPKVGEGVFVISQYLNKDKSQRYYIGPIIAQPQFMFFDSYLTSTRTLNGSRIGPDKNILFSKPEQTKGVLPKDDTVALLGRRDSDVFLEDNELYIRCGVKKHPSTMQQISDSTHNTRLLLNFSTNQINKRLNHKVMKVLPALLLIELT